MAEYTVVAGNIGTVYHGSDHLAAVRDYIHYVKLSKVRSGRAAGESVVLMKNGEPEREFEGEIGDQRRATRTSRTPARNRHAYGVIRDYPKIEIFYDGRYVATTTWARTIQEAREQYAERYGVPLTRVRAHRKA